MKKMYNLILDNHAENIKLLLFKKGQSIPGLYNQLNGILRQHKVFISESTFKNYLMDSSHQNYNWVTRLRVINLILDFLSPGNIEAAYEMVKQLREKQIRSIMELLDADYKDKREYSPIEVLLNEMESLPNHMKTYWEDWKSKKM